MTKEECTYALNDLKNIIKDILGEESCVDECIKTLQKLIDEHFEKSNVFLNVNLDEEKLKRIVDERISEYFRGID